MTEKLDLTPYILKENKDYLAINKPRGMVVNRSSTTKTVTLQELSEDYLRESLTNAEYEDPIILEEFVSRSGIVHRLDKDTTGVLLIAKNPQAFADLKANFLNRTAQKTYHAVVFGDVARLLKENEMIHINLPLARNPRKRMEFAVVKNGREAESLVFLATPKKLEIVDSINSVANYKDKSFSIVRILPKTGRTHQIRVHLKALNHEILGDIIYSGKKQMQVAKKINAPLMLHASVLEFTYNKKQVKISAPVPEEFAKTVKVLWKK